jgi:hypothetical protein
VTRTRAAPAANEACTHQSAGRSRGLRAHGSAPRATQGRHRPRWCRDPSQSHGPSDGGVVGLRWIRPADPSGAGARHAIRAPRCSALVRRSGPGAGTGKSHGRADVSGCQRPDTIAPVEHPGELPFDRGGRCGRPVPRGGTVLRLSRPRPAQLFIKPGAERAWLRPTLLESRRCLPKRTPPHAAPHSSPFSYKRSWSCRLRRATLGQALSRHPNRLWR